MLLRTDFQARCQTALALILKQTARYPHCAIIVGHPHWQDGQIYNSLSFLSAGQTLALYHKQKLPNYDVFDEHRYFSVDDQSVVVDYKNHKIGLLVCEDLWHNAPLDNLKAQQAEWVISINASPYDYSKPYYRQALVRQHANRTHLPIIYLNQVGAKMSWFLMADRLSVINLVKQFANYPCLLIK